MIEQRNIDRIKARNFRAVETKKKKLQMMASRRHRQLPIEKVGFQLHSRAFQCNSHCDWVLRFICGYW